MDFAADIGGRAGRMASGGGEGRGGAGVTHHTNHVGITASGLDSTCRATGNSILCADNADLSEAQ